METIDDTKLEEDTQVEETTEASTSEETVENFSEELDNLETEDDIINFAKGLEPDDSSAREEEDSEPFNKATKGTWR